MTDLRHALRQLWKRPGFTAVAVLTLALGIGANTAIYSLIHAFLFQPVVARDPDRLVGIYSRDVERANGWRAFSVPNYRDLRASGDVFEDVLAMVPGPVGVTEGDTTRRVFALTVSANYFEVFGVAPFLGRAFTPEEDSAPAPVVMVSHRWWERNGADPEILGHPLRINGRVHTVVGVAPPGFGGTTPMFLPDLFFPLGRSLLGVTDGSNPLLRRDHHSHILVGRLRPGLNLETANAGLEVIGRQLAEAYPEVNRNQRLTVERLPRMAISTNPMNDRAMLGRLGGLAAGLAGAVLFIACLNLANMLLARGMARRREIAVRIAVGAGRGRVVRQLLIEGLLLALIGGAVALWIADGLVAGIAGSIERVSGFAAHFPTTTEWPVLLTTLGACALATVLFALGPAIRLARTDVHHDLKAHPAEDASGSGRGFTLVRNALVVGQVALSLALLVGAGLFARSAVNAVRFDPGFPLDRGLYAEVDGGMIGYTEEQTRQRYEEVVARLRQLPGVEAASLAATVPMGEMMLGEGVQRAGMPVPAPPEARTVEEGQAVGAALNVVGSDYFRTIGLPLVSGREFTPGESERAAATRVAIVNTVLARQLWPEAPPSDAVGRRVQIGGAVGPGGASETATELEVVGVAAPQRNGLFEGEFGPMLYLPCGQRYFSSMLLHVRTRADANPGRFADAVRGTIAGVDANLPVLQVRTLPAHFASNVQTWLVRTGAFLFGALGASALLLAMLGVYGVKSYAVSRRTREIGIRVALGSTVNQVVSMLLRDGLKVTAIGLAIGMVLGIGVAAAAGRMLVDVGRFDPWVLVAAPLLLAGASLLATWLPARRAASVDPMVALRTE